MNQVGAYPGAVEPTPANTGGDYSMFVPQLSPVVPQSTARPYDSAKYVTHVQEKPSNPSGQYYHQDGANQEVHFRSPNYPIQNTPPLAHSASQKCILPNENNTYPIANQKVARDYVYQHRDYSVVAHNYSPQKINPSESKISPQGTAEDPSYCLSKPGGYVSPQNIPHNYPIQNSIDRRVSPHNPKSPIYRNYPQNNGATQNYTAPKVTPEYPTQNANYYMDKPSCVSQKQVLDARYVQNYNQNYAKNQQDSKHPRDYRNVKKASPPFPILEQRLNQTEANYCQDYSAQGYYPSKYASVMFSRTSPTPKIVTGHNYIHNQKIPPQDVMMPQNYTFPNKYYPQNQGQEWKIPKDYEQNMYLSQMNQMHARLPHNTISKPTDLSYVDQNQRLVQKGRMYCPESSPVEHLQYTGKSVVPITQKSPKIVGYTEQRPPDDYLNLPRPCGTIMKSAEYQRTSKVAGEYGPVIQSVKAAELGYDPKLSREYMMHQQACRNDIPNDQQSYVCPPTYPAYPRQSNIKINEMPARNISPRRTFQENMPVVVFSPQHIGLPKNSPNQIYQSEYPNTQHYPGYYPRDPVYPASGVKPHYPIDQSGKYSNIHVNRNIPQQRFPFGYPEHQYYQNKHIESPYYQGNMYRAHYNPNLPEHLQQNVVRGFEGDYRNTGASNYNDFDANRVDDRAVYSKKDSDIGKSLKEFLESWEDDEEIVANLPDLVLCNNIPPDKQKLTFGAHSEEASEASKSFSDEDSPKEIEATFGAEQPLYILGSTNISTEALPQYLAVYQQVDRLPDNIKGFYKPSTVTEDPQPVQEENTEKTNDVSEPKSVIRESLSPHDLTVNKNRDEERVTEEEEVLNLSTNRNKENDEFLVEEYSNASEENSPEENQETKKEPDTSNKSSDEEGKQKEAAIPEETLKTTDDTEEKNVSNEESKDNDCLTEKEPEKSPAENEETNEEKPNEEHSKQPAEKSLTASVIVPNKFFDNTSLSTRNDLDKLPVEETEDPIVVETVKPIESTEEQVEIPEDTKTVVPEDIPQAEQLENLENTDLNTDILEEIEDDKLPDEILVEEVAEKIDLDVIDFQTAELLPQVSEDPKNEEATTPCTVENEIDELVPISFDNLIDSPENIEMKDDEDTEDNFSCLKDQQSEDINSSPATPTGIDLSLPQKDSETVMEEVAGSAEEEPLKEEENLEVKEADKSIENDSEIIPDMVVEEINEDLEEIITEKDDTILKEAIIPKDLEESKEDCSSFPNLSLISECDIKQETEDVELCTPDELLEEIEASTLSTDKGIVEDMVPKVELPDKEVEEPESCEEMEVVKDLQEPEPIFESTVDKLVITNVESIQDDSSDSITPEEESNSEPVDETIEDSEEIKETGEDSKLDTLEEYAHLIDIEKTEDTTIKEGEDKPKEDTNFDFSYLESCTDNICEKSEDTTDKLDNNSNDKIEQEEVCNNDILKSILDSSESDSDISKDKEVNIEEASSNETCTDNNTFEHLEENSEIINEPEPIVDEAQPEESKDTEEPEAELKKDSHPSETDTLVENVSEIEEPELSEISSEISSTMNDVEIPETSTEIIPIETVEENLDSSVIITENVSSEDNIILPEDSECVVIYSDDEQYLIIQPDTETAEIIPSEQLVVQETEIIIPEVEATKEEDIIVEEGPTEPGGEEIIICEEGIEDWVQNEEIIENEEEKKEVEQEEVNNIEDTPLLKQEKKINILDKLKRKKMALEKKKFLIAKRKKKIEKLLKQRRLNVKQITETFINEEKIFSYPDGELSSIVEDKELFINPENPDTLEYNNNSSNFPLPDSSSIIKRRVSYGDFTSPKIDFKAPKRRYSSLEIGRSVKKPIINLDEISKNITEVLENFTKQETIQYQNLEKPKIDDQLVEETTEIEINNEARTIVNDEKKLEVKDDQVEEDIPIKNDTKDDIKVTKLVEQLIKPKLIIPKTNFNLVTNTPETKSSPEQISPLPIRKPLLKTPEVKEDSSSPVLNTARLTEPIFPKSSLLETKTKRPNVDPRIERPKEVPEKEEKQSLIENKLSNTFGLTEYTKNYIKMKTGQIVDPKNICGINGSKRIDPRLVTQTEERNEVKNNIKKKIIDDKSNEKKVKINLQDYRNRKQSISSPQLEDTKKSTEENKVEKLVKPKKSPIPDRTNPTEPKVTNNTNNRRIENDSNAINSKIDLTQSKPKKRKRRFRNLYTIDEEDEVPTKHPKNSLNTLQTLENKLNGILTTNEDSTSSSKTSEDSQQSSANSSSGSKINEDSQSSEMSSSTNGEFLCCLDLNSNGTSEENCGFKCHIKLNALGEKTCDYEINKNSCSNPNRLKLTLKPVKKKKPAFSEVLSNLDSLVENEIHSKRQRKRPVGNKDIVSLDNSEKNGDGTHWTIKNKVPKVIIKRNASGYCAVFRDVSSNPLWQPKIRLKRQKYIESLVLRNNVKF